MLTVGVTGRSGSGKSTVARHYAGLGHPVADGDAISREVCVPGSKCLRGLVDAFGNDILAVDGTLDRKALAARTFGDAAANQKLVEITHPHIIEEFLRRRDAASAEGKKLFFADGAMIVGGPFERYCDKIIVLESPVRLSISRIILRDGISKTAANTRLAAQPSEAALRAAASYVIENDGGQEQLLAKADAVLEKLLKEANGR